MRYFTETLTEVKTNIMHASISLENETKALSKKEEALRLLKARRAIEQHLEQRRLYHDISNGWDD